MAIFNELWFWMLIVAIVTIGFGIYVYEVSHSSREGVPIWAYLLLILGAVLLIIAFVLGVTRYHSLTPEAIIEAQKVKEVPCQPSVVETESFTFRMPPRRSPLQSSSSKVIVKKTIPSPSPPSPVHTVSFQIPPSRPTMSVASPHPTMSVASPHPTMSVITPPRLETIPPPPATATMSLPPTVMPRLVAPPTSSSVNISTITPPAPTLNNIKLMPSLQQG